MASTCMGNQGIEWFSCALEFGRAFCRSGHYNGRAKCGQRCKRFRLGKYPVSVGVAAYGNACGAGVAGRSQ